MSSPKPNAPARASSQRWGLGGADGLLICTILFWGVNFSVVKFALAALSPLAFNGLRFVVASIVLLAVVIGVGQSFRFQRRHLAGLIGLGLLGNTTYQLFFVYGIDNTTADNASLILATVPAWVALIGTIAGVERVEVRGWLGVLLSLAGIGLIIAGSDRAAQFQFGGATLLGDLLMLGATLCWSCYTLLSRPLMRHYPAAAVTSFSTAAGTVPLLLIASPAMVAQDWAAVPISAWMALIFSGTFGIALAYVFWNFGISRMGSARTALYSNLVPPIALITAWLWLGETLTLQQGLGALIALSGVILARRYTYAVVKAGD